MPLNSFDIEILQTTVKDFFLAMSVVTVLNFQRIMPLYW